MASSGGATLETAARKGDASVVRVIAQDEALVAEHGVRALQYAAEGGHTEAAEVLIEAGVAVNSAESEGGATPLAYACSRGKMSTAERLLDLGADIGRVAALPHAPRLFALVCQRGSVPIARAFLSAGLDANGLIEASPGTQLAPLHFACVQGHRDVANELIEAGADVNVRERSSGSSNGRTALMAAAGKGHLSCVERLIECGAEIEVKTSNGRTALWIAACAGEAEVCRALLHHGASADISTEQCGWLVEHLLNHGSSGETTALVLDRVVSRIKEKSDLHILRAAQRDWAAVLKMLVENGWNVDAIEPEQHLTPLHVTAARGCVDGVRALVEGGGNVCAKIKDGHTPLDLALKEGHEAVAEYFLGCGEHRTMLLRESQCALHCAAYRNMTSIIPGLVDGGFGVMTVYRSNTALHMACQAGALEAVKQLLDLGAGLGADEGVSCTPLHVAAIGGHPSVIEELLERGADVNAQTDDGITPLYLASEEARVSAITQLIQRGADVNVRSANGSSPLFAACQYGSAEAATVLLDHGARIDEPGPAGTTPLMAACIAGSAEVVAVLIQRGADREARNEASETALSLARQTENNEVTALLQKS